MRNAPQFAWRRWNSGEPIRAPGHGIAASESWPENGFENLTNCIESAICDLLAPMAQAIAPMLRSQ
jgi:hypothetical protein